MDYKILFDILTGFLLCAGLPVSLFFGEQFQMDIFHRGKQEKCLC